MEIKSNNGWWFSQYNMHGKWAYTPHKKTYCDHDLNILSFVQELINAQVTVFATRTINKKRKGNF